MAETSLTQLLTELSELTTETVVEREELNASPTGELVRAVNSENAVVPGVVDAESDNIAIAIDMIAERMSQGGRLIYLGAGTAGRMGVLDASEIPQTFGTEPDLVVALIAGGEQAIHTAVEDAADDEAAAATELADLGIGPVDSVIGISASGRSPYVVAGLQYAREAGSFTVGLSANSGSEIGHLADLAIEVVTGPEFITGSTRIKAGTAQKLVLNMISTLVMVRLGKTYRGVMVDLVATNAKLRARSVRTVMTMTGVGPETAFAALESAEGSVKRAILAVVAGVDDAEAVGLLDAAGGHLGVAIARSQTRS